MPEVNICIPTYNGSRYLVGCFHCVLRPTCKYIEMLAVDDESTDATVEILARYASSDQRNRLCRIDRNLGQVGNWDRCVELIRSELIKFVFPVDLLESICLAKIIAIAQEVNLFVACCKKFDFEPQNTADVLDFYFNSKCFFKNLYVGKQKLAVLEYREVVASDQRDFPFWVCWAIESWSEIWHSTPKRGLIVQAYTGADDPRQHFEAFRSIFTYERYIKVEGKLFFAIYQPTQLPDPQRTLDVWLRLTHEAELIGIHLVGASWVANLNPADLGFDSGILKKRPPADHWYPWGHPIKQSPVSAAGCLM